MARFPGTHTLSANLPNNFDFNMTYIKQEPGLLVTLFDKGQLQSDNIMFNPVLYQGRGSSSGHS